MSTILEAALTLVVVLMFLDTQPGGKLGLRMRDLPLSHSLVFFVFLSCPYQWVSRRFFFLRGMKLRGFVRKWNKLVEGNFRVSTAVVPGPE